MTPTQIGAAAADRFFAAGGSPTYGRLSTLNLNLSNAFDDVEFANSGTAAITYQAPVGAGIGQR